MGNRELIFSVGFFLSITGYCSMSDCSLSQFGECLQKVHTLSSGVFHITNDEQMKEVCEARQQADMCTSQFMKECMKQGERDVFEATTSGRLKIIDELCKEGSSLNKEYLQNRDCWSKVQDGVYFCSDKMNESQIALTTLGTDYRKKIFYGCCAFEWHRNCLATIVRAKCDSQAAQFAYDVSTHLGGATQQKLCSDSYSSCYGLYGVDQEELDEMLNNIASSSESYINYRNIQLVTVAIFILAYL